MTSDPTSPWEDYNGHSITQRELAALLRQLQIHPSLVGAQRLGGYRRKQFLEKEVFQRFLGRDPLILSPMPIPSPKLKRAKKAKATAKKKSKSKSKSRRRG
jgi:hypothetical protein